MSRREPVIRGPDRARESDIDEINRVFSDAFTERYHRDGMGGVRVPLLNPAVWRYALAVAGEGALVWRDGSGDVAAFNLAHVSGGEGWMGPLAVRPDRQGRGLGRRIVTGAVGLLQARGCQVIGLETMPRTIDNIGFYSSLGFRPGHLTITLARDVSSVRGEPPAAGSRSGPFAAWVEECRALAARLSPIADFSREIRCTFEQQLGDVTLVRRSGQLAAFALWHTVPLAVGRSPEEIRILKLAAVDVSAVGEVAEAVSREAAARGLKKVTVRCQTGYADTYRELIELGFRVHWTDLRMTLAGYEERTAGGVVFSNWEI
jgi:ribosomal protein S18 acetylase RimI-like enzyme